MDLETSPELIAFGSTVGRALAGPYSAQDRLKLLDSPDGYSMEAWRRLVELGVLDLATDESPAATRALCVTMTQIGRALALEPVASTALAGRAIAGGDRDNLKAGLLDDLATGEHLSAFAGTDLRTTDRASARRDAAGGWHVTGTKTSVPAGDSADSFVVVARLGDGAEGLFHVSGQDVARAPYRFHDGRRGADVTFHDSPATALSTDTTARGPSAIMDLAVLLLVSEAIGVMEKALSLTVDYLKVREQFGRPLSTHQVLQHRAADMYVALEQARSLALAAEASYDASDPLVRRRLIRSAKVQADLSGRLITHEAVQLHGGVGMTMEYPVGHYLRRMSVIRHECISTSAAIQDLTPTHGVEFRPRP